MRCAPALRARGFTLVETMIALVVLGIAAVGALSALMSARQGLKDGQGRVVKAALADGRLQTLALARDSVIATPPVPRQAWPGSAMELLPAHAAPATAGNPWVPDPGGAFFRIDNLGAVTLVAAPPGVTKCDDAGIPSNVLCREIAFTSGLPATGANPASGNAYTLWVRVWRSGDRLPRNAYSARAVFVQ